MGSIEAVYIVDLNGRLVLDYAVASSPPSYQTLLPLVIDSQEASSVAPIIEISSSRLLFHLKHGNIMFLVPCSSTTASLVPFEFINRFIETLESYFSPPIIPMKIESNYDTVALILSEMIDAGYPYISEPNAIRDLVPYGSALSKLLTGNKTSSQVSQIPWRRANVRHTNNELFVDIVETLHVIIAPSGRSTRSAVPSSSSAYYTPVSTSISNSSVKPIVCRSEGTIFVTSHLSGIPDILLILNSGNQKIEYPSFHQCIRQSKWKSSVGTLSFIPPDGRSLLVSYTIENPGIGLVSADLTTGLGAGKDEFEVRVWTTVSRETKSIEGLCLDIVCDPDKARTIKSLRVTVGDFHTNDKGIGEWRFVGKTPMGWNATLRGIVVKSDDNSESEEVDPSPIFPRHVTLSYQSTGQVPSGLKVLSLKVLSAPGLGEGVKPFKGVRYITRVGEYVVR